MIDLISRVLFLRNKISATIETIRRNLSSPESPHSIEEYERLKTCFKENLERLIDINNRKLLKLKKRERHKKWKKRKFEKKALLIKSEELRNLNFHLQIDSWREMCMDNEKKLKEASEKEKLDHKCFMLIRQNQNEFNRLKILYEGLNELRKLRRQKLKKEGHFFPEEDNEFFQTIQDDSTSLAFGTETRFATDNSSDIDKINAYYNQGAKNLKKLLKIRKRWDAFICSPETEQGSSIPVGSILACLPSSLLWKHYLLPC